MLRVGLPPGDLFSSVESESLGLDRVKKGEPFGSNSKTGGQVPSLVGLATTRIGSLNQTGSELSPRHKIDIRKMG